MTPNWVVFIDGAAFNTVGTSESDGWGGRGIIGIHHQWNLGAWHPFIGPHGGYIGGKGVQDGALIGPEMGVNIDSTASGSSTRERPTTTISATNGPKASPTAGSAPATASSQDDHVRSARARAKPQSRTVCSGFSAGSSDLHD